jgi:hypothetical protein
MTTIKKSQLNIAIPQDYRNLLRRMAAEKMLNNPSIAVTGTSIAAELLISALKELEKLREEGDKS